MFDGFFIYDYDMSMWFVRRGYEITVDRISNYFPLPEKRLDIKSANIYRDHIKYTRFENSQVCCEDFGYGDTEKFFQWYADNLERKR